MLPASDQPELERALQSLVCRVEIPAWYRELQARHGQARSPVRPDDRRRFARFYFLTRAVLRCHGNLPVLTRGQDLFVVQCLDISRNGIAFLHEGPLYPEEEVSLWLPVGRKTFMVSRCNRHNERCYEIGAKSCGAPPSSQPARSSAC